MKFEDVIGQNQIKNKLISDIKENLFSHSYIFEGPKGIGKMALAKLFSGMILCEDNSKIICENCASCVKINAGSHPDVHIINIEEEIKKDDIEIVIAKISQKPYESKYKVFIVNDCHKMNLYAANSFLKTLEEPPADTIIILLTTNINLLLDTIVSRCQLIKFEMAAESSIMSMLKQNYDISGTQAKTITAYSKGMMHRAAEIAENKNHIFTLRAEVIELVEEILNGKTSRIYGMEIFFEKNKKNIEEIIELFAIWIRDLIMVNENMEKYIFNADKFHVIKEQSKKINSKKAFGLFEIFQETFEDTLYNVNYKLSIYNMLFSIREVKNA